MLRFTRKHNPPAVNKEGTDAAVALSSNSKEDLEVKRNRLILFLLANALTIACFALFHRFTPDVDLQSDLSFSGVVCLVTLETILLMLPALIFVVVSSAFLGGAWMRLAIPWSVLVSAIYFIDFALLVFLREHLFSSSFAGLLVAVGPFLHQYITWELLGLAIALVVVWLIMQSVLWWIAKVMSRRSKQEGNQLSRPRAIVLLFVACLPIVGAVLPALLNWERTQSEILAVADRHPVTVLGVWSATTTPQLSAESEAALQGSVAMLSNASIPRSIVQRYQRLRISIDETNEVGNSKSLPDIVIVVSECFRADVMTQKSTPRLFERSRRGLRMTKHVSSGNSSNLGFFGVMFGLDAHLFSYADQMPVGILQVLEQVGYETGFFGRAGFDTFSMETFCSSDRFGHCHFSPITQSVTSDKLAVEEAVKFFDRTGDYETDVNKPRIAVVYVYSPHEWYHEEQDDVHSLDDVPKDFRSSSRSKEDFRRFLNSIHFMDRVIDPLFNERRIAFVTGDHGESFGEDGRIMHGSALSEVQTRVACVGFGPGIPDRSVDSWTSHVDLLPTVLQAIGAQASDKTLFQGTSLLEPVPSERIITCRSISSRSQLLLSNSQLKDAFGYVGFFDWGQFTLAPGAWVDSIGDAVESSSGEASWDDSVVMRDWLNQTMDSKFANLGSDPEEGLRQTILSDDPKVVLESIRLINLLGEKRSMFQAELQQCLAFPDERVRDAAFKVLHTLARSSRT